jgi:archaellum component FlaC
MLLTGFAVLVMASGPVPAFGQDTPPDVDSASGKDTGSSESESAAKESSAKEPAASKDDSFQQALKQLQAQLDAQNKQIEALKAQYASEVTARQKEIDKQDKQINAQEREIAAQREAIQSLQQEVDQARTEAGQTISESEKALRSRLETVEQSIQKSEESESTTYDLDSFPGSLPIPGSSAAIKFGGFVKMNVVQSFDPIGTTDRFIVGSIPVPEVDGPNQSALTVSQSRLSVEMRDTTQYGPVRAFLEADFAGNNNTFRLRHAFGQYKSFLIGKTWTTFMDTRARPEDLDREGINGQIFRRQAQVRYFPRIGQDWHLLFSAEEPSTVILNGDGISQFPDLVASVERDIFERWHVKSSLLYRKMYGECNCLDNQSDTAHGWAISVSGMTGVKRWDERDNMQIQLSYGEGYSHYINDLGSIQAADAVFDQSTGQLSAVPAFAMYAAFQKWWTPNMRSSFIYGYVNVENKYLHINPDGYNNTSRFSANFIWSPISRIDLGAEFLYGTRSNQDGENAKARQIQLSAKYRY